MVSKNYFIQFFMVSFFFTAWMSVILYFSVLNNQSFLLLLFMGFLFPFTLWSMLASFVIYLQHTNPNVRWYDNQSEWMNSNPHITAIVHMKFPNWISSLLHHIMEHTAHHLNSNIPCYNLKVAQKKLEEELPEHIVVQDFSWKWYLECTRICKLYDFEKHEWVDFPNKITS